MTIKIQDLEQLEVLSEEELQGVVGGLSDEVTLALGSLRTIPGFIRTEIRNALDVLLRQALRPRTGRTLPDQ